MMASYGGAAMMSVQELSREGAGPPQPFIWRKNQEKPIDASPPTSPIPAVDLELLFSSDGDARMGEMEKLLSALKSWGLFQVMGGGRIVKDEIKHLRQVAVEAEHMGVELLAVGHGIPTSLIDDVGKVSREYFDLPKEEKEKFSKAVYKDGDENDEIASEDEIKDWCHHLYLVVLPEDERDMSLWPENPCKLREILSEYTRQLKAVIKVTLKAMGKLLDLEEDYFLKQFDDKAAAYARFNYYPRCSRPDLVHGLKPHSDDSGITILLPDQTVEGLEVCKDSKWVEVNALPYALIINVGDQMEVMSNGMFKSPVHRAVANSVEDRISLVMFLVANAEKEIGPADGLIDEENGKPRLYKRFKVKEYRERTNLVMLQDPLKYVVNVEKGCRIDNRDNDNHIVLILVVVAVGGESTIRGSRKTYFFVLYNTNICRKPLKRKLHYAHWVVASGLDLGYA
ncbi:hypothetical protein ACLOJK_027620 [Asimina triloba]